MLVPIRRRNRWLMRDRIELYFLHVPKCGGSFVEATFKPWIKKCPTQVWPDARGHLSYREYSKLFAKRSIDLATRNIFAVVRNPWAWHVSWFHYLRQDENGRESGHLIEHRLFQKFSFHDYLVWLEQPDAPASPQNYLRKQMVDFLIDEKDAVAVQTIMRQETLAADLRKLCNDNNLAIRVKDRRVNASTHLDYRHYYSDEDTEIIAARHARDIALFGYDFNDARRRAQGTISAAAE